MWSFGLLSSFTSGNCDKKTDESVLRPRGTHRGSRSGRSGPRAAVAAAVEAPQSQERAKRKQGVVALRMRSRRPHPPPTPTPIPHRICEDVRGFGPPDSVQKVHVKRAQLPLSSKKPIAQDTPNHLPPPCLDSDCRSPRSTANPNHLSPKPQSLNCINSKP